MRLSKRTLRNMQALLLLWFFLFLPLTSVEATSLRSSPLMNVGSANGMVRIKLSSLGQPSNMAVTVRGSYSLSGLVSMPLGDGSVVFITFDKATGQLFLSTGGQSFSMGTGFRLRRHSTSGNNGLLLSNARVPGNLYPGDLSFSVSQSGGTPSLSIIANIFMEDYLYGVLPYEMGNSSHGEALKAQAVTARTYTMRAMSSSQGRSYDVVDTTSDQVYNGTPSGSANCKAAVNATRGIVMRHGGQFSATFYTATNGGQTESPGNAWGSASYSYLTVRDDPYDYANPSSNIKTYSVPSQGAMLQEPLRSLLLEKARAQYPASGNIDISSITTIIPHTPKHPSPSRLYTRLDFYVLLTVDGHQSSAILSFDIFSELESKLALSISTLKNELWSVKKTMTGFVLEARRYGHGIGMSQRGAMRMGEIGYTYDQIIAFYYPGCARAQYSLTKSILSAYIPGSDSQAIITPETPSALEGDTTGYATVRLKNVSSVLPVYAVPGGTTNAVWALSHGTVVSLLSNDGVWSAIRLGNISGYVRSEFLEISGTPSGQMVSGSSIVGYGTVVGTTFLNLREAPVTTAKIYTTIPPGTILPLFDTAGGWGRTQYMAQQGYVMLSFLKQSTSYPGTIQDASLLQGQVISPTGFSLLRSLPSTSSALISQLPNGVLVTIQRRDSTWALVSYEGQSGYMLSDHILLTASGTSTPPTEATNPPPDLSTARVTTPSGSLNLRTQPSKTSKVLTTIPRDTILHVNYVDAVWAQTQYASLQGYVMREFLSDASAALPTASPVPTIKPSLPEGSFARVVSPNHAVLLYHVPGAEPIGGVLNGDMARVLEKDDTWTKVVTNGLVGYIQTKYLSFSNQASVTLKPESNPGNPNNPNELRDETMILLDIPVTASVLPGYGSVNLRKGCSKDSALLREIPIGDVLYVTMRGETWCAVIHEGVTGYCMTRYLQFDEYY